MPRPRRKKRKNDGEHADSRNGIIMPSPHDEMLRGVGLTAAQWEEMQERVRTRREQQEPFRAQLFEDYVRGFVEMARERYLERMERLRQEVEKQQQQGEQRRDEGVGEADR